MYQAPSTKSKSFYVESTKLLTPEGWLPIDQCVGKNVISLSLDETITLDKFITNSQKTISTPSLLFENSRTKILTLPSNKLPIHKHWSEESSLILVSAKDLSPQHRMKTSGLKWEGKETDTFILPGAFVKTENNKTIPSPPIEIPLPDWLKFFSKWMASGYISQSGLHVVFEYQGKNRVKKLKLTTEAVEALGFKHSITHTQNMCTISINSEQLCKYLKSTLELPLRLPRSYLLYSRDNLKILLKEYIKMADREMNQITAVSRDKLETLQELILKSLGSIFQIKERSNGTFFMPMNAEKKSSMTIYPAPRQFNAQILAYAPVLDKNNIILINQDGVLAWVGCASVAQKF